MQFLKKNGLKEFLMSDGNAQMNIWQQVKAKK
jgi:hypothetical protein